MADPQSEPDENTRAYLRRRQVASLTRQPPGPGKSGEKTLRQIREYLSLKRSDLTILTRIPRDFEDVALDLDARIGSLHVREVFMLAESAEDPTAASDLAFIRKLAAGRNLSEENVLQDIAQKLMRFITPQLQKIGLENHMDSLLEQDLLTAIQGSESVSREDAQTIIHLLEQEGYLERMRVRSGLETKADHIYKIVQNNNTPRQSSAPDMFHRSFWGFTPKKSPESTLIGSNDGPISPHEQNRLYRLASYVPNIVIRDLALRQGRLTPPIFEEVRAAVLFADISGFTALTEKLVSLGTRGFEQLVAHLNEFFRSMISIIDSHGGDIIKFAGDALLIIWPTSAEAGLRYSALVASQCAVALRDELSSFSAGDIPLRLHLGISVGNIACIHVGTVPRMEFVIAGQPLADAAECEELAAPGQIFISDSIYKMLENSVKVKASSPRDAVTVMVDAPRQLLQIVKNATLAPISAPVKPAYLSLLTNYAPEAVIAHLQSDNPDNFLAEVRSVSVVFINLNLKVDQEALKDDASILAKLQDSFNVLQNIVAANGGSIRQFIVDDKGTVLIAAWGLPPKSHEDDAELALRAGIAAKSQLAARVGLQASIGITTGRAFCGAVGSDERREYAVVGDVVNLSARLMGKAAGRVICCRNTYQAASNRFSFETLPPVMVKGKPAPIDIFQPLEEISNLSTVILDEKLSDLSRRDTQIDLMVNKTASKSKQLSLVGLDKELKELQDLVDKIDSNRVLDQSRLKDGPQGFFVRIEGEFGTGKSRLASKISSMCVNAGLTCATAFARSSDTLVPFSCFKGVICNALGIEAKFTTHGAVPSHLIDPQRVATAMAYLKVRLSADWMQYAPLLREVLPEIEIPDTAATKSLFGYARAYKTTQFCLEILKTTPYDSILVENGQWMDSMSWALVHLLLKSWCSPRRLFTLCMRLPSKVDTTSTVSREYTEITDPAFAPHVECHVVRLSPLSAEHLRLLTAEKMSVDPPHVSDSAVTQIFNYSFGNPLVATELLTSLVDSQQLRIINGVCEVVTADKSVLKQGARGAESALASVVTTKLDALSPTDLLLLKVAATIGREFRLDILYDVYTEVSGSPQDAKRVALSLETLESQGFIKPKSSALPTYAFRFGALRDVVYELMLFGQRKLIHQKIAEWLTKNEKYFGLTQSILAYHWREAENFENAVAFLSRCAIRAFRQGAHAEAVASFEDLVATFKRLSPAEQASKKIEYASWCRMMGYSLLHVYDPVRSQQVLLDGLAALSATAPADGASRSQELMNNLKTRMLKIVYHLRLTKRPEARFLWSQVSNKELEEAMENGRSELVRIYKKLSIIKFFEGQKAQAAFCAFEAMHLASRLGLREEYIVTASLSGFLMTVYGEYECAEAYPKSLLAEEQDTIQQETLAAHNFFAGATFSCLAQWEVAQSFFDKARKAASASSEEMFSSQITVWSLWASYWSGHWLEQLEPNSQEAIKQAEEKNDSIVKMNIMAIRVILLYSQHISYRAKKLHEELETLASKVAQQTLLGLTLARFDEAALEAPLHLIWLARHSEKHSKVLKAATKLAEQLEKQEPLSIVSSHAVIALYEAAKALYEHHAEKEKVKLLGDRIKAILNQFAAKYFFVQPLIMIMEGETKLAHSKDDSTNNHNNTMTQHWTAALQAARKFGARHLEAIVLSHFPDSTHKKKANAIFDQQGVVH